ncbi:MAG: nickel pincer cofactor biosynthesis protein LarC [Phascolarctobacterium sp.]|nr:nickel pincer cofactor biosynthesis protein LarC [Phascolarctobacterium sp.]MBR6511173.1 nickel pincer cofactor biosynthesis protein LarC [Phascolarctobacterium sp.]
MKAIYLETFAGISGNMLLGALLDAGFPIDVLKEELTKLNLGEYELVHQRANKLGIDAQYFNVLLPHGHEHSHNHEHHHNEEQHYHCQEYVHTYDPAHHHEHHHEHKHEEHAHEHHHHEELPHTHHHHEHRNLKAVMEIIDGSTLSQSIKDKAREVFTAIAIAEAKVHGKTVEEVHFHEVGAIDTIIDIVGCLLGLEYLGIEKVYVGKITTGHGFVKCAHGLMPVPAPATAELLQGLPQEKGRVAKELTTPTGAALAKVLGETALELPEGFACEKIAYGAGTWNLEIPNVLRVHVGSVASEKEASILEVACNIDDMSGEVFAYVIERLLLAGALDAWAEPIVMKKGRPAYKLVFLVSEDKLVSLLDVVFEETTTLGVRYHKVERSTLERRSTVVATPFGSVAVKYGFCNGAIVNIAPEFESCKEIAANAKISLKKAMQYAQIAAEDLLNE